MSINLRAPLTTALLLLCLMPATSLARSWSHEAGTLVLEQPPERIVALNWAAAESLLLLGITPVGVADLPGYSTWVREPEMPDHVANVGTRVAPSLETIAELKPDLIVTSAEMAPAAELLQRIAPTYVISVYKDGTRPFEKAREMLRTLADMTGRSEQADAILADIDTTLEHQRHRLRQAELARKPIALVSFLDDRHVRIYTSNSLFQTALDQLGLANAWPGEGNYWGFSAISLDAIADTPESRLVVIEPLAPGLPATLSQSPFWTYLPPVRNREVYQIPPAWPFGGILPVKRLAVALTDALIGGGQTSVH
ncbi:MAG TPA: ABC transporter substrate-binding protein [Marinobacter sp.]|nr:ABC transporter substrate-binding protein [Marinobacter sp.]